MKKIKENKTIFVILIVVIIAILIVSLYRQNKINLLDKKTYNELIDNLEEDSISFKSQKDLRDYITRWADQQKLKYIVDDAGNIIFNREAVSTKKNVAPTVIVCNYNYENAKTARRVLSSAALIANTNLQSGQTTVIFVNNKKNDGKAYSMLDESYFPDNAKVIFLDDGKKSYVSESSFARATELVEIPTEIEETKYDSAVKVHIAGIPSDLIDTSISNHTNPISLLSTLLSRFKSKSIDYQMTDLKVGNEGNKYPTSVDVTFVMNSYSIDSFKSYLDGRIEKFDETFNEDDYPDAVYSYEVIDNPNLIPSTAYTSDTSSALNILLYTLKNGNYRFEDDSIIPENYEAGDIYAINCVNQIFTNENENIKVGISTQALDKKYMKTVIDENATASELSNCELSIVSRYKLFKNNKHELSKTLQRTYTKVCDLSGSAITLNAGYDTYFTAMTYLDKINSNMDIVHIKESSDTAKEITNMLLCYIQTKGNLFSL